MTLTLPDALAMAYRQNPEIHVAQADIAGARAGVLSSRAYPNPVADYLNGHQYQRLTDAVPGQLQHYGFAQQIDLPNQRSARIAVARLGETSTRFGLDEARLRVRSTVKQAFYEVLRRQSESEVVEENMRLVEDLRRRINVQVDVGEAGRLELTRADAELATARAAVRSAQLRYVTAISTLRAAIGAPMTEDINVKGSLQPRMDLPPLEALQNIAISNYPLLKQADTEVQRARAELKSQKAQRIPQPVIQGYYEHQPDLGFFELGVSVPIPIFNRRQGPIAEAEAAIDRSQAARDYQRLQLITGLETAYGAYEVADEQVRSLESGALRQAEAALTGAEVAYRAGERGIIEVLDAQRVLRSVRLDYLNAQYDRQAALIDLERLRAIEVK